jgi:hypothetical protein
MPPFDFTLQTSNFTLPRGDCAKQSQTWEDWGIWEEVFVSVVARPGVKRAKRTQFLDCGLRIGDCGLKEAARGRVPKTKRAERTQFEGRGPGLGIADYGCRSFGRLTGRRRAVGCEASVK